LADQFRSYCIPATGLDGAATQLPDLCASLSTVSRRAWTMPCPLHLQIAAKSRVRERSVMCL